MFDLKPNDVAFEIFWKTKRVQKIRVHQWFENQELSGLNTLWKSFQKYSKITVQRSYNVHIFEKLNTGNIVDYICI